MLLSCVPPVAASFIAITDTILHIAPVSRAWKADAPGNVVFLPPTITQQALLLQIALLRPSTLIVGDQTIDADVINHWRTSHPFGHLYLVRRGTSVDKVRLDLCEANDIQVINTPGVNAPHIADYIARWLAQADGALPREVCVLGYGNVGQELVRLLLDRDPDVRINVLVRTRGTPAQAFTDTRVAFVVDWFETLRGASAVAICLSLNDETTHCINHALIQCMHRQVRLICVAKPDVFSDDALRALAVTEDIQLVLDHGPLTLDAFRVRTQALGGSVSTWRKPATLTTQAATTDACHRDLDYAVSLQLSLIALHGLVRRKCAQSLAVPATQADTGAPRVSIIGRGINSLFQALMLRLANYQVTVYGGHQPGDDAVNMRHLSATPPYNRYLHLANEYLTDEFNRAGMELFDKLLEDNPSINASDYRLDSDHLMDQLTALLQRSGVEFLPQSLSPVQIAALSREHLVMTALGREALEGLWVVYCSAYNQIVAGATYSEGTTQGVVWACLAQEIIQARATTGSTMYQ